MRSSKSISIIERLIAAGTYVTFGMVGFLWLLFCALSKTSLKNFLKYHIFQSFFLVMGFFLLKIFIGLIMNILSFIPFIKILVFKLYFLFTASLIMGCSLVDGLLFVALVYLALTSIQGKYTYVPWFSNIIRSNVGR